MKTTLKQCLTILTLSFLGSLAAPGQSLADSISLPKEHVSVGDFSGTANQRIDAAIAAAQATTHKTVFFPNGTYELRKGIGLGQGADTELHLIGESRDGVFLIPDIAYLEANFNGGEGEALFSMMDLGNQGAPFESVAVSIQNMTLDKRDQRVMGQPVTYKTIVHGIRVGTGWEQGYFTVNHVTIRNTSGYGIGIQDRDGHPKNNITITNVHIERAGSDGIDTKEASGDGNRNLVIRDISVNQVGFLDTGASPGIDIRYRDAIIENANIVSLSNQGVNSGQNATGINFRPWDGGPDSGIVGATVSNVYLRGTSTGIRIDSNDGGVDEDGNVRLPNPHANIAISDFRIQGQKNFGVTVAGTNHSGHTISDGFVDPAFGDGAVNANGQAVVTNVQAARWDPALTPMTDTTFEDHVSLAGETYSPAWIGIVGSEKVSLNPTARMVPVTATSTPVTGQFTFDVTNSGTMQIDFDATFNAMDKLIVDGELKLNGTLKINVIDGTPTAAGAYQIFEADAITGSFDNFDLPSLGGGLVWNTDHLNSNGVIIAVSTGGPSVVRTASLRSNDNQTSYTTSFDAGAADKLIVSAAYEGGPANSSLQITYNNQPLTLVPGTADNRNEGIWYRDAPHSDGPADLVISGGGTEFSAIGMGIVSIKGSAPNYEVGTLDSSNSVTVNVPEDGSFVFANCASNNGSIPTVPSPLVQLYRGALNSSEGAAGFAINVASGLQTFSFAGSLNSPETSVAVFGPSLSSAVPVADDQSVTTEEDNELAITLTATDADGDPLIYSLVSGPTNGALSGTFPNLTYTPNAEFSGSDSFTFKANDLTADSNTATVSITVNSVNDAPVWNSLQFDEVGASATQDYAATAATLVGDVSDVDDTVLTFAKVDGPAWLSVGTDGTLSGTPPTTAAGENSFVVSATDPSGASSNAIVNIDVGFPTGGPDSVNVVNTGFFRSTNSQNSYTTSFDAGAADKLIVSVSYEGGPANSSLSITFNNDALTLVPGTDGNRNEGIWYLDNPSNSGPADLVISGGGTGFSSIGMGIIAVSNTTPDYGTGTHVSANSATVNVLGDGSLVFANFASNDGAIPSLASPLFELYSGSLSSAEGAAGFAVDVPSGLQSYSFTGNLDGPEVSLAVFYSASAVINVPPVWDSNPVTDTATALSSYSTDLTNVVTDSVDDTLTFAKVSGPAWLSVAPDGVASGTPPTTAVGLNTFTVSVTDSNSAPVEALLEITVNAPTGAPGSVNVVNTGSLVSNDNQTSYTTSFNAGAADKLIVSVSYEGGPANSSLSITFNDDALTLVPGTDGNRNEGIWYLDNPSNSGPADLVISGGGTGFSSIGMGIVAVTNSAPDYESATLTNTNSATVNVLADGSLVFANCASNDGAIPGPASPLFELYSGAVGSSAEGAAGYALDVTSGSQTYTFDGNLNGPETSVAVFRSASAIPGFSLSKAAATVGEGGGTDSFTVVLDSQPTSDVVINLSSLDTQEATVAPSSVKFTQGNWDTPQNIIITGVNDNNLGDDTTTIIASVNDALSDDFFDGLADQTIAVTCTNNDASGSYAAWIDTKNVGGEIEFGDDTDGDGLVNGIENYFGTDPSDYSLGIDKTAANTANGTINFRHPLNASPASDLTATYLWSKDLINFYSDGQTDSEGTSVSFVQGTASGGMVTVTATISGPNTRELFVAIQVSQLLP